MTYDQIAMFGVLNDVVNHYNSSNRAVGEVTCVYWLSDDKQCAYGRYCNWPDISIESLKENCPEIISEIQHQLPDRFWRDLQNLHDCSHHWNSDGLTESGKFCARNIRECISNGEY